MFVRATLYRATSRNLKLTVAVGPAADAARFGPVGAEIIQHFPRQATGDGLWEYMLQGVHRHIVEMVERKEASELARTIADLQHNNLGFGIGWSSDDRNRYRDDEEYRWLVKAGLMDNVGSLAAMTGLVGLENPEAGQNGKLATMDGDALMCDLDGCFGYELRSPTGFAKNLGIARPSGAVCDYRTLWAAGTSERVVTLLRDAGVALRDAHVLEIGGGVGNLALHCLRRGVGRYTIVDLPTTRAVQTYVAMTEFPDLEIGFTAASARLNLLTPDAVANIEDRSVDLVINEDSLPEMAEATGRTYVREIARISRGDFLSLNHESGLELHGHRHPLVSDLCRGILERRSRALHWMRRGYVDEVYAVRRQPPGTHR